MVGASNTAANAAGQLSSTSRDTYYLTDGNVRIPVEPGQKVTVKPQAGQRFRLVKRPPYMVDENVGEVVAVATEAGDAADLVLMADNGGQVVLDGFYSTNAFVELAGKDGGVFVIDRTTSAIQIGADGSRLIHFSGDWSALQGLSSSFAAQYEVLSGAFLLQGISVPPSLGWLAGLGAAGGAVGAALGGSSSRGADSATDDGDDDAVQVAPTIVFGTGVGERTSESSAMQSGGAVRVTGGFGETVTVVFQGKEAVTKSFTSYGTAQAVRLTEDDLEKLGEGTVTVTATGRTMAGKAGPAATTSFVLDLAPEAPVLELISNIENGATRTEALQETGVMRVFAEAGSTVSVIIVGQNGTVLKTVLVGSEPGLVKLTEDDLERLGDGPVDVSATATDAVGNRSDIGEIAFNIDTSENAPDLSLGNDLSGGGTAAEVLAHVVAVSTDTQASITVTFTRGSNSVVKTVENGFEGQHIALTNEDIAALGDGTVQISAIASDAAGNVSTAATSSFVLDTVAPEFTTQTLTAKLVASANIVLTFSESIIAGSGMITLTSGSQTLTFVASDTSQVTISGDRLTINPTSDLIAGVRYEVTIGADAVRDVAGNEFAGLAQGVWGFDTQPAPIYLTDIANGIGGFAITGSAGHNSGYSVAGVGDFNGDGLSDILIGAPGGTGTLGRSYIVWGKANNNAVTAGDLSGGQGGIVLMGENVGDMTGQSVAFAGDVNGDGYDDVIIGASEYNGKAGMVYVAFGGSSNSTIEMKDFGTNSRGFYISSSEANGLVGYSVAGAGDVNGDGYLDILVGANGTSSGRGRSYIVFGKSNLDTVSLEDVALGNGGFVIDGETAGNGSGFAGDGLGYSVSAGGDINGDGYADLLIGAPGYSDQQGRSYVMFGRASPTSTLAADLAAGAGGFAIIGESGDYGSGHTVAYAGDVNGDGFADIVVTAPAYGAFAGRSYVVFGKTSNMNIDLADVAAGTGGFVITRTDDLSYAGFSVSVAGDVNGDGFSDLLIGAFGDGKDTNTGKGMTYVVFGKTDNSAVELETIAAGEGGFAIIGEVSGDHSGFAVAAGGDVNGDGFADLVVTAKDAVGGAGRTYVIFGNTTGAFNATHVTETGTDAADSLTDGGNSRTIVAGAGNDSVQLTGASIAYGGLGDDNFIIGEAMRAALGDTVSGGRLARIDGGAGNDTITLQGSGMVLDLTQLAFQGQENPNGGSRISSIEKIDLTGSGDNMLILDAQSLRSMVGNDSAGTKTLFVDGNSGDMVDFSNDALWSVGMSQEDVGGTMYNVITSTTMPAVVYLEAGVTSTVLLG
ncbi:hypothetical protein FPY71_05640 [Aureimonas fodinaquatilis]|uniref:SbsA Ig-like domain-containing protein n=1 Tax=Aureimonas fodinaquatilis TaxID=2565783 RepID=A0A5B0E0G8_9HYPH|nr:Ig-like domain-containing protein [Aureimonas fodinaquatilis]KAA0972564.1 hypothetical protein FPY71_05640 [Aureimonas fodinaquatilis]